jgi:hypothetical protein
VLFMTSVRSVGAQMSPEVLVELVRANVIRPKLALYYVMLKDDRQRGAALRELVPLLPENLHGQAIDVARSIVRADDQARSLMQVASVARGTRQVEARAGAVSAASRVTDARTRVGLLRELQKDLPDELSAEVSELLERAAAGEAKQGPTVPAVGENPADPEAAGDQRTEWDLAFELLHAAASGDASVVRDAWERALRMADTVARAHALVGLVRRIPEDVLVRVPALLRAMEPGYRRMELIEAVAPRLSPAMADELAELAVATSRYYYLSKELSALAPRMTSGLRRRLLAAVTTETYGDVVAAIAPALADDELTEAWALASSIPNRYLRREGVKALAERVTAGLIRPLLLDVNRAASVLEVLDVLPPALLTEISGDAIETAARLGESEARASTVKALAKWLPQEQLPDLVALAAGIADADARAGALGALAPRLRDAERPDLLKEIHESSLVVGDAELIAAALTSLLPAASPAVRDRVESFVEPVVGPSRTRPPGDDVQSTLTTIFALLLRLSFTRGDARRPLVKALRAASDSVRELDGRAFVMAAVARHTATDDDSILAKARDLGSTRDDENLKRWFAAMIAPVLDPSDRDATVTQMRQVAAEATADGAIDDDKAVMFVISSLLIAPHLPTDFDAIARDLIAKMADPDHRVVMDALYTGRAGGGDVARAMAARMQTTDPISRSVVPLLLVPRLGEDHDCFPILDDALAQCAAIGPRMSVALGIAFVEGGIDRLLATAETSGRIVTKSLLARVGGEYAVTETADALIDASRWWP